jgi:BirA family biotin operon repressor/biotin-[acetyl-CoA-carboxylase] ligase
MEQIGIKNPFPGASAFLIERTESTQEEAKRLAERGYPPGSLIAADAQRAGRGRFPERRWKSEAGKNLLFTIYLDTSATALPGLPLRIGLALCAAVSDYAGLLGARFPSPPRIKWPNDLLIGDRKAAGILCEADPAGVFAGIGLNCNQSSFPYELEAKATSLAKELGREVSRWALLELCLEFLQRALADPYWQKEVDKRLWRRGEKLSFLPGTAGRGKGLEGGTIVGILEGIDEFGSILIRREDEERARSYPAGELTLVSPLYKVVL